MAKRVRVTSFAGRGALVQGLGLLIPVYLGWAFGVGGVVVGAVLALVLFVKGSAMSISWRCGACRNPLHDKRVRMCPVCKATVE